MTKNQKIISLIAVVFAGVAIFLIAPKGKVVQPANINLALNVQKEKEQPLREVNVKAFQFGYEPNVINVKKGEKIKINIE